MHSLRRVEEERRRACRGQRGGQLPGDDPRLADPGYDRPPSEIHQKLDRADEGIPDTALELQNGAAFQADYAPCGLD